MNGVDWTIGTNLVLIFDEGTPKVYLGRKGLRVEHQLQILKMQLTTAGSMDNENLIKPYPPILSGVVAIISSINDSVGGCVSCAGHARPTAVQKFPAA